jgi:putative membrane protein
MDREIITSDGQEGDEEVSVEQALRDRLAVDRTALANERTFLAYVRTGIALFATGLGLVYLFETRAASVGGLALLLSGPVLVIWGARRFRVEIGRLRSARKL